MGCPLALAVVSTDTMHMVLRVPTQFAFSLLHHGTSQPWGEYLLACNEDDGKIYEWQLNTASAAAVLSNAPTQHRHCRYG